LFLGFWNRKLGILGALGSSATFIVTVTQHSGIFASLGSRAQLRRR
jgi:uncharacterized membrane protein YkgB